MSYSLEAHNNHKNTHVLFTTALFLMSILLHQSQVLFGVNISFSDIFGIVILIAFVLKKQLVIPISPLLFFVSVSIVVLVTAVFYVPYKFMFSPDVMGLVNEYAKLLAIFVYFLLGYNLAQFELVEKTVKWYSLFGILIGGIGIVFTVLNMDFLANVLFYGDTRYRGFMIDPNYFSVLQITALVFFSRAKKLKMRYKCLAILITVLSVLLSGSKTGIITLFGYLALRIVESMFAQKQKIMVVTIQLFLITLSILVIPFLFSLLQNVVGVLGSRIPSFARVQLLFTDFSGAITENGSGRNIAWNVALQIIQISPFIGIGIGTYTNIAIEMFQQSVISHNTFLQLAAEWGIPLAVIFFSYVFFILGKATNSHKDNLESNLILRDIIIILLIGSMAISLNNARILWIVLGALVSSLNRHSTIRKNI